MDELKLYLKEEYKKFKGLPSAKSKAGYLWDYYRLWIGGTLIAVFLIVYVLYHYMATLKDYHFFITFANTYAQVGDGSDLWEEYVEYTGYDTDEKLVYFNNNSYFDYRQGVTGNTYFATFVAHVESGDLDAVTMGKESLTLLGESGRLMDLDSEECASIKEKYGELFVYSKPYDRDYGKDKVPVGIDITDSRLNTEYKVYGTDCALGIGAKSKNIEAVEMFLDMIFSEEK